MTNERLRIIEIEKETPKSSEVLSVPEIILNPQYRAIGVFGRNGAGNTTLAKYLAKSAGMEEYADAGQDIREATGNDSTTIGFIERSKKIDVNVDKQTKEDVEKATSEHPFITSAKLSGYIMGDMEGTFRILVTVPRRIAINRIRNRALERIDELEAQIGELSEEIIRVESLGQDEGRDLEWSKELRDFLKLDLKERRKNLTVDKVLKEERDREQRDFKHWGSIYPDLRGIDIYNPGARVKGKKLYDYTISTKSRSKDQTAKEVINYMLSHGIAKRKK